MSNKSSAKKVAWTKSELYEFAIGLQKYGFSQKEKIAENVRTRDKKEVIEYLNSAESTLKRKHLHRKIARAKESPYNETEKKIILNSKLAVEVLEGTPIRKWSWMARSQQSHKGLTRDYSQHSLSELLRDFYEEAPIPATHQEIDVKAIYKFLIDCVQGTNPTELMPKESGLVLMLLKKLREFQDSIDLDEERRYFTEYRGATKFAPLKVEDEENGTKDRSKSDDQEKSEDEEMEKEDNIDPENAVKIPEELYNNLRTYYKLVESFNPLMVPLWFLNKHQAALGPLMENTLGWSAAIPNQDSDTK